MGDSEIYLRSIAAKGLARIGTNAQQTVPDLIPMLNDSNALIRSAATNALKAIDPEAAAKAGVK
jgi:HEAT repeat protein